MRINEDGNLALAKNIGLGGATPTTSGFGITFPGTQSASTDANTLDDYEEGTWTPRYSAASGGELGGTQIDSNNNYTKIGRLVNISFAMYINSINLSGKSGVVTITGLPFTSNGNFFAGVINSPSGAVFNSFINIPLRGLIDSTNIVLYKGISSGVEQQLITTDFNTAGGNGNYILISAFYIT